MVLGSLDQFGKTHEEQRAGYGSLYNNIAPVLFITDPADQPKGAKPVKRPANCRF